MADFASQNANFYLHALACDKMADFASQNANFYLGKSADKIASRIFSWTVFAQFHHMCA
jgi:hypothetical protein